VLLLVFSARLGLFLEPARLVTQPPCQSATRS